MSVLKFLSLNVRGLRNEEKRRSILSYLKIKRLTFIFSKKRFQVLKTRRFGRRNGVAKFSTRMVQTIPRACVFS